MLARTPNANHVGNNIHQSKRPAPNQIVNIKSSRPNISQLKLCVFQHESGCGYGFKLTGTAPVRVQSVKKECSAWKSGLRENDVIHKVNDVSVIAKPIEFVIDILRRSSVTRLLVEPVPFRNSATKEVSPTNIRKPYTTGSQVSKDGKVASRPISVPKAILPNSHSIARPKSTANPEIIPQKPITHQPIRHNNNSPLKKLPNESKGPKEKYQYVNVSQDLSSTSSSSESDILDAFYAPVPPKPRSLPNPTPPIISNSFNIQPVKMRPPHPPIVVPTPKMVKTQTIPADGAKSYNIDTNNDYGIKSDEKAKCNTLPKQVNDGRFIGREFNENSENDEETGVSFLITMLKSTKEALSKPGLVAILLNYVKEKADDLKIMIFYYACKLYKSLSQKREFHTDAQRMAVEIITTFLHIKSPLYIDMSTDIITEISTNYKIKERLSGLFDSIMEQVYERLQDIVADVRGKLERGIQLSEDVSSSVNVYTSNMNQDREMNLLYRSICNIFTRSQKESDFVLATQIGLATMYQYFHGSTLVRGSSTRARSTDSINKINNQNKLMSISEYFKIPTLCASYPLKSSQSSRKKSKTVNGHVLIEDVCMEPEVCAICDDLLWGVSPQGFYCTMCTNHYHTKCKKKIKTACARKLRKSNSQLSKEEKPALIGRIMRKASTNSARSPLSADLQNNSGNVFFGNGALLPNDKISPNLNEAVPDISKSHSADQLNRSVLAASQFERIGSGYNRTGSFGNQSVDIGPSTTNQSSVQINELVQDESLLDPDMRIDDTFDADAEINSVFPNLNPESDRRILIVLLEFYHKARYILMNLKRYLYSIVRKWPPTQYVYFKALSLDCINPLVELIKSLVETIKNCVTEQDFVGLPEAVLHWLSEKDEERLKEWLSLSSNLCCTNSLNAVKQLKQTTLSVIPELANLLRVKFNKRVMIDDLAQIRPLLISLPFIAKNIIKSLCKEESKYAEDIGLWKQISTKMDYLVEFIDRCCIPLVEFVNNGSVLRRQDKFDGQIKWKDDENDIRDFYNDFPRTLFHFLIFDFQSAKIIDWSTNTEKFGVDMQTGYFKKGTEVLLLIYKTFMVVLQKENEHYFLKPIKSLKSGFEKKPPIIAITGDNLFKNGGQEDNQFVLNVISNQKGNVLLVRIGFSRIDVLESLMEFITTKTYNLARSLSLFKSNELLTDATPYLDRNPSTLSSKSKASNDNVDSVIVPVINPDVENKELEIIDTNYLSLDKALAAVYESLDSKSLLCSITNIQEDEFQNKLQLIKDDGVKSIEELILVLYSFAQSTVQNTQQLVAKACSNVTSSSDFDVDQVKKSLMLTYALVDKWEQSQQIIESISPEVVLRQNTSPRKSHYEFYNEELIPKVDIDENAEGLTNGDFHMIVDEIVNESINGNEPVGGRRDTYKYIPSDSSLPAIDTDQCSEGLQSPLPNDKSPIDEMITVSRAQIVVPNRNSVYGSSV